MSYHSNTTGVTGGAETTYASGAPALTTDFSGVRVTRSLVLCVTFLEMIIAFPFVVFFSFGDCLVCLSIYEFRLTFVFFKLFIVTKVS